MLKLSNIERQLIKYLNGRTSNAPLYWGKQPVIYKENFSCPCTECTECTEKSVLN